MKFIQKRKISEIIQMYKLEPTLHDIWVEGITDKLIFESFLNKNNIVDVSISEIDNIDFYEYYEKMPELKKNNKAKVIALSKVINSMCCDSLKYLTCIVDRDFDDLLNQKYDTNYLILTDFTCLEMYFFNQKCINHFYKHVLHSFPIDAKTTIEVLSEPLKQLFLFSYSLICLGNNGRRDIDIKKTCNINKETGQINFNFEEYFKRMLHKLNIYSEKDNYLTHMEKTNVQLRVDSRFQIRGHDFIYLFFIYINKIKNNSGRDIDMFQKALFLCIDYNDLSEYNLFSSLLLKYS